MSKDLFLMMREEEVATQNFLPTKKELAKSSKEFAKKLIDSGEYDLKELYSQAIRNKEAINNIESVLKSALQEENFEAYGLKGTYRNGGDTPNFKEDDIVLSLEKKLSDRKELLKLALKSDNVIYDSDGAEVPKVSTTPIKSSLSISF